MVLNFKITIAIIGDVRKSQLLRGRSRPNMMTKSDAKSPQSFRPLTFLAIGLLRIYQWTLSPFFAAIGVRCRHLPTCSHYGCDAYARHGFWIGSWLTLSRLLRCHPLGTHGFDPVPEEMPPVGWRFWRHGRWSWRANPPQPKSNDVS